MSASRRTAAGLAAALVVALGVAPLLPSWARFLVTVSLGKGLVVLGLLLLMRTGLVAFGQGLYYALGAYAAGLAADRSGMRACSQLDAKASERIGSNRRSR